MFLLKYILHHHLRSCKTFNTVTLICWNMMYVSDHLIFLSFHFHKIFKTFLSHSINVSKISLTPSNKTTFFINLLLLLPFWCSLSEQSQSGFAFGINCILMLPTIHTLHLLFFTSSITVTHINSQLTLAC